ncbi:MAG TPA: molybdate ABC transporter substrate-binding protein [Micromonosporaceae bacterium]|jgi:molybdate transport system substrate-binding protein
MARTPLHRTARTLAAGAAAVLALALTACSSNNTPSPGSSTPAITGTINVFAAASLTETFNKIGSDFEAAHPGTDVVFNFGSSGTLATQIDQGAPADVFASASPATMKQVTDAGNGDGASVVFVRNQLVIVTEKGNPKGIQGLADLAKPDVKVALCVDTAPCGAAAKTVLTNANVALTPVFGQDVKATLQYVTLGEVDAALVYRTDAKAEPNVDPVEFPESSGAINDYPIVALKDAANKAGAQAFVAYVLSDPGIAVLTAAGFQKPTS